MLLLPSSPEYRWRINGQRKQLQYLTQIELARRWRMSPRTLEGWRWLKHGPAYFKFGHVLYRLSDIESFEREHMYLLPDSQAGRVEINAGVSCLHPRVARRS